MIEPCARKTFKTPQELEQLLIGRGLDLGDHPAGWIARFFEEANYYNVINGYNEFFLKQRGNNSDDDHYKVGSRFVDICALWQLDRELKNIYIMYLRIVEERVKAVISNVFSAHHDYTNYLSHGNFDTGSAQGVSANIGENVTSLVGKIHQEISLNLARRNKTITHFMENYGYIPPWVLMNILSFRLTAEFYKCMKPEEKAEVSDQYGLSPNDFSECISLFVTVRNVCSHDERFYDKTYRMRSSLRKLLTVEEYKPMSDSCSAFDIAILLTYFLRKQELENFVDRIGAALKDANNVLRNSLVVKLSSIKRSMGFPRSWRKRIDMSRRPDGG